MALPKYDDYYKPVLVCLSDMQPHKMRDVVSFCADYFSLSDDERNTATSSGASVLSTRVSWARTYLQKAGLLKSPSRGTIEITSEGKAAISDNSTTINNDYLLQYDQFRSFIHPDSNTSDSRPSQCVSASVSPQEQIDIAIYEMNSALADELMDEIMKISPYDFEKLIIKLLISMGYGSKIHNEKAVTPKSNDEGIDGILTADKFGFDSIYIQAKQWKVDSVVGRPDIQKFVGAMAGQGAVKGLFITTARFSKEAEDYANKNLTSKIVLVDGLSLAKLMIEFNVGVSTIKSYELKKVDTDFFTDLN